MENERNSYRQIFKATSLFGGVQVFNIIVSILRSKIIAVLLGPEGMGVVGLFTSTTGFVAGLTNFGLATSAVKNVSAAYSSHDKLRIGVVVAVLRRLVWLTGALGLIVVIVLSPWLSQLTFGNDKYTIAFVWLSVSLLLDQISAGQGVVLRGMRQINFLAKASLTGSILGLIISVPLYYLFGIDGIVPAILLSSLASLMRTYYFSRKVKIEKVDISVQTTVSEGKEMLVMGFMLSISSLLVLLKAYGIRVLISNVGGVAQVGLFTAGFAIINSYVGMIFSAMSTDYFPRLSGVASDEKKCNSLINQQAQIAILILSPFLTVFFIFIGWIVVLLYSSKFLLINDMIQWAALGMYFKAVSWSIGFIFLAKGSSKLFFYNELASSVYGFVLNVIGYYLGGLNGLGITFFLLYFFHLFQVFFVSKYKYGFSFEKQFYKVFVFQLAIGLLCFGVISWMPRPFSYFVGLVLIMVSSMYSYHELDKRIGIKSVFKGLLNRKK
jgi:O-antigen/teichoic acid export membrane protein